jgi:hypothetical protein
LAVPKQKSKLIMQRFFGESFFKIYQSDSISRFKKIKNQISKSKTQNKDQASKHQSISKMAEERAPMCERESEAGLEDTNT